MDAHTQKDNSPRSNQVSPDQIKVMKKELSFEVIWKDLSYIVSQNMIRKKTILDGVSGFFRSGQLMAVMGPSGCGKSSLLGCISGAKRKGVTGSVTISINRKV